MSHPPPVHEPPMLLLPQASRMSFPKCLLVDLRGLGEADKVLWTWPARRWRGADVVTFLELAAEGWPATSWRGFLSDAEVARLRMVFGGKRAELEMTGIKEDLDELLKRPRRALRVSVWSPEGMADPRRGDGASKDTQGGS